MKIGIVGAGMVGASSVFSLVMRGIGREIVLVDVTPEHARAQANDIFHAVPFAHPLTVRAGAYADLAGCPVVILAAGVSQRPGENRLELLERNLRVFQAVVPQVISHAHSALLLVATNPVDIMTHITSNLAKGLHVPEQRVIGTGTTLDTARFRGLLGRHLGVDPGHIHGYVLGEHGDTEVLAWSVVTVGGMPLEDFCQRQRIALGPAVKQAIDHQVRNAASEIIAGKGATCYGIASALAKIVDVIIHDQRAILTVCSPLEATDDLPAVTLSLPHLLGGEGVIATLHLPLSHDEETLLGQSADMIAKILAQLPPA